MKRLIVILALSTALGVAGCEAPNANESDVSDIPMDAPIAPAAEDVSAPIAAPSAVQAPPADSSTLPAEKRSSEESVQPESETLFY